VRSGSRLYLAGGEMLKGEALASRLRPSLPRKTTVADALLWIGIDARQYAPNDGIVLLRPERIVPRTSLAAQAIDLEIGQLPDADRYYQGLSPAGSLFLHWPQEARVRRSTRNPRSALLHAPGDPSGPVRVAEPAAVCPRIGEPRRAGDRRWRLAPVPGQEESLRALVAAYRQLPAIQMERVAGPASSEGWSRRMAGAVPAAHRPWRSAAARAETGPTCCVANDAPFATTTRLRVEAPPPAACRS